MIDMFKNLYNLAFIKFMVMIIFTILLNFLCKKGLSIVSWFIVFIPFIMMTIITSLVLFTFGLSPSQGSLDYNVKYPGSGKMTRFGQGGHGQRKYGSNRYRSQGYWGQGYGGQGYNDKGGGQGYMDPSGDSDQGYSSQSDDGQGYGGQGYSSQSDDGQGYGGQGYSSQSDDGQGYGGQGYSSQSDDGQDGGRSAVARRRRRRRIRKETAGQDYSGQDYSGQDYSGQDYAAQEYAGPSDGQGYRDQEYRDQGYQGQGYDSDSDVEKGYNNPAEEWDRNTNRGCPGPATDGFKWKNRKGRQNAKTKCPYTGGCTQMIDGGECANPNCECVPTSGGNTNKTPESCNKSHREPGGPGPSSACTGWGTNNSGCGVSISTGNVFAEKYMGQYKNEMTKMNSCCTRAQCKKAGLPTPPPIASQPPPKDIDASQSLGPKNCWLPVGGPQSALTRCKSASVNNLCLDSCRASVKDCASAVGGTWYPNTTLKAKKYKACMNKIPELKPVHVNYKYK